MHSRSAASFAVIVSGEVQASKFSLVKPSGVTVAALDLAFVSPSFAGPALVFDHGTPSTSDSSYIGWTNDSAGYPDSLAVRGPGSTATSQASGLDLQFTPGGAGAVDALLFVSHGARSASVALDAQFAGGAIMQLATISGGFTTGVDLDAGAGTIDVRPNLETRLNGRKARMEVYRGTFAASASPVAAVVAAAIAGCTTGAQAFRIGDEVDIHAVADVTMTVAGAGTALVELVVDGVVQGGQAIFTGAAAGDRKTIAQNWTWTSPSTGNHTLLLQVRQTVAGATYTIGAGHTTMQVRALASK